MTTDFFGHTVAEDQAAYGSSSPSTTSKDKEQRWWSSLRHGGCLIAPSRLAEYFPHVPETLPRWTVDRLRRDVGRLQHDDSKAAFDQLLETVFVGVLGLSREEWVAGNDVPQDLSIRR